MARGGLTIAPRGLTIAPTQVDHGSGRIDHCSTPLSGPLTEVHDSRFRLPCETDSGAAHREKPAETPESWPKKADSPRMDRTQPETGIPQNSGRKSLNSDFDHCSARIDHCSGAAGVRSVRSHGAASSELVSRSRAMPTGGRRSKPSPRFFLVGSTRFSPRWRGAMPV